MTAVLLLLLTLLVVVGAVIGALRLVAVDGYRSEPARHDHPRCL